jgi:hypothetical protein
MQNTQQDIERKWEVFVGTDLIASGQTQSEVLRKVSEFYKGKVKPKSIQIKVTPQFIPHLVEEIVGDKEDVMFLRKLDNAFKILERNTPNDIKRIDYTQL